MGGDRAGRNTRRLVTGDGAGVTLVNPGAVESSFWDASDDLPDRPMLTSGRLAAAIVWAISQPPGVDVNTLTIRPVGAPIA
jgi:NADP-dependent 3-hydroxy acid dehydrogenase YdfG